MLQVKIVWCSLFSELHGTSAQQTWIIFILVINRLDAQNFCFTISLFS